MEALNILYVGDAQHSDLRSQLSAYAPDSYIMQPQELHEALAMYVLYFPDVIILEGCSDLVREVYYHLASGVTQASPQSPEAFIVIADGARWPTPANALLTQLPAQTNIDTLLAAVEQLRKATRAQRLAQHPEAA
ncbi:MAG: hypothetical protein HXY40_16635 [Chloroflexi bacterium]|nr:hypothetical protein [Chloroflexota bacterium]